MSHGQQGLTQITALKARSPSYQNSHYLPPPVVWVLCRILAIAPSEYRRQRRIALASIGK
jgi:hypothetical protein